MILHVLDMYLWIAFSGDLSLQNPENDATTDTDENLKKIFGPNLHKTIEELLMYL